MPNYTLDLPTLITIFHEQKRTGELRAENVRLKSREAFQVRIVFYLGKDVSYTIEDVEGNSFAEGDIARQLLIRVGRLEWDWIPQQLPDQQTQPLASIARRNELGLVFQRSQLSLKELSSLPRAYQRLVLLVDGQRTVAQIAALFPSTSVQEIYRILTDLRSRGWLLLE